MYRTYSISYYYSYVCTVCQCVVIDSKQYTTQQQDDGWRRNAILYIDDIYIYSMYSVCTVSTTVTFISIL